jgi:Esterase/lipase
MKDKGSLFVEKYVNLMFSSFRKTTHEDTLKEIEVQRIENRKPVKVPRKFRNFFQEETFPSKNGFDMPVFTAKPTKNQTDNLVLYLHGGAFIYQPVFFHWRFIHSLVLKSHSQVVMPIYPKSPEYKCLFLMETLLDFYQNYIQKLDYKRITIIGDSAGACIGFSLAQEIHRLGLQKVDSIILISPCLDLTYSKEDEMKQYQRHDHMIQLDRIETITSFWRGNVEAHNPLASPIFGNMKDIGHISLFVGTHEILLADARFLRDEMKRQGIPLFYREYSAMFHTFPLFPVPEGFMAMKEIVYLLK